MHPTEGVSVGQLEEYIMKTWTKPAVREQEVGLEVTSYLPAEIDVI
jgi:coenzyme PQQ precursor peptide PqqA